jgi:hypothetical protein
MRTKLLSLGVLALVFASGLVVGLAVDRRANAAEPEVAEQPEGAGGEEASSGDEGEGRRVPMYEQVGLRPGQDELMDSIVAHHRESMRALEREFEGEYQAMRDLQKQFRDAYNPRYWAIVESTRAAIRTVFDEDQAQRYDSLLADFDRKRRSERHDSTER